jgi:hypothetical protein
MSSDHSARRASRSGAQILELALGVLDPLSELAELGNARDLLTTNLYGCGSFHAFNPVTPDDEVCAVAAALAIALLRVTAVDAGRTGPSELDAHQPTLPPAPGSGPSVGLRSPAPAHRALPSRPLLRLPPHPRRSLPHRTVNRFEGAHKCSGASRADGRSHGGAQASYRLVPEPRSRFGRTGLTSLDRAVARCRRSVWLHSLSSAGSPLAPVAPRGGLDLRHGRFPPPLRSHESSSDRRATSADPSRWTGIRLADASA